MSARVVVQTRLREGRASAAEGGEWVWRYRPEFETDSQGRRVFQFHRRFVDVWFGHLDVLLAVSMAAAVAATSDSIALEADHVEMYLRRPDAIRLGAELGAPETWPKWCVAAELIAGEPQGDAHLTVVVIDRRSTVDVRPHRAPMTTDEPIRAQLERMHNETTSRLDRLIAGQRHTNDLLETLSTAARDRAHHPTE